ncbi:MAG: hypothetical protein QOF26_2271 [Baekduia sp.]|jgi:NAD(P)-dependent dehydrogenase (short-subunit alcohol dehydrogenase family)|nr:hypothetical protein [Baekduia sp.]MDX6702045.1 hypothetical protein [Baekduia sp.]
MSTLLTDKTAIIYGAAGGIGSGVARTFAREGATVFLAGRTRATLEALADEIRAAGGRAEVGVVDALDEAAVDAHAEDVAARAGSIDVSFNLITRGDVQGVALLDMAAPDLTRAVVDGLTSTFFTARAAGRRMVSQGSGVILGLTSGSSRGAAPMMGSTGPADAATEVFLRHLASEVGPHGVRVAGIHTAAVAETLTREKIEAVAGPGGPDPEQILQGIAAMTMLRRPPALADVAETAAFLASDRAAGITSGIVNVTCGLLAG